MASMGRNKEVVRLWVTEIINGGHMDLADEIFSPALAEHAKRWVTPFRASFPDVDMRVVDLVAEGDTVVGRFLCSGTQTGFWQGQAPTGRRFEDIDEVYFFKFHEGKIVDQWGLEDTKKRMEQLGLD